MIESFKLDKKYHLSTVFLIKKPNSRGDKRKSSTALFEVSCISSSLIGPLFVVAIHQIPIEKHKLQHRSHLNSFQSDKMLEYFTAQEMKLDHTDALQSSKSAATTERLILEDDEDPVGKLLKLLQVEDSLSNEMRRSIRSRAKNFLDTIIPDVAKFLREDLDPEKHSAQDIRTIIQSVPSALSNKDEDGLIPIQSITWDYSDEGFKEIAIPFIPLLAEEGLKYNIGGDGMRGGLLCAHEDSDCVLQEITSIRLPAGHSKDYRRNRHIDNLCLGVIKELREKNLFFKEDIENHDLIVKSCDPLSTKRFQYLAKWNPEALTLPCKEKGISLLRQLTTEDSRWHDNLTDKFHLALKAVLQHHSLETSLLFSKDEGIINSCTTVMEAYKCFGSSETWALIKNCLEGDQTKRLMNINPQTNMYPFMTLATNCKDSSQLDFIYYMIRQSPESFESADISQKLRNSSLMIVGKKRKRL
jgi:hypothetical protein